MNMHRLVCRVSEYLIFYQRLVFGVYYYTQTGVCIVCMVFCARRFNFLTPCTGSAALYAQPDAAQYSAAALMSPMAHVSKITVFVRACVCVCVCVCVLCVCFSCVFYVCVCVCLCVCVCVCVFVFAAQYSAAALMLPV